MPTTFETLVRSSRGARTNVPSKFSSVPSRSPAPTPRRLLRLPAWAHQAAARGGALIGPSAVSTSRSFRILCRGRSLQHQQLAPPPVGPIAIYT